MLNSSEFSYEPRNNSGFPEEIELQMYLLGNQFNFKLFKINGLLNTASLNSQVWIKNGLNTEIKKAKTNNLVSLVKFMIFHTLHNIMLSCVLCCYKRKKRN